MEFYSAFIIGLVGSLHCIGMCGPVAMMLPLNNDSKVKFIAGRILYNAGRITTYALIGLLIGFIGSKIFMYGLQQVLSVLLGLTIITVILLPLRMKSGLASGALNYRFIFYLKQKMGKLLKSRNFISLYFIGFLNGFLPCGLVYVAIGTAAASGTALSGMAVMILFGLGTMPVMFAVSSFSSFIPYNFRNKLGKIVPVFAVVLAIIFILRGLNLGIPYISPKMNKMAVHQSCNH